MTDFETHIWYQTPNRPDLMTPKPTPVSRRKYLVVAAVLVACGVGLGAFFIARRPPRFPMEQYIPANALAFVEVDSLGQLVDGLTSTRAWRELAPLLGISSQLRQVGQAADVMGRLGLGPSEAVIAGRAQYALAVTGLEAATRSEDEGPSIQMKPHFVLVIKTHATADATAALVRDRAQILARRIFGDSTSGRVEDYSGARIQLFDGPTAGHQFIAAAWSDVVLVSNDEPSLKACLDVVEGRSQSLALDQTLNQWRKTVDKNASVFGFLTAAGVEKISGIAPALLASSLTSDPDRVEELTDLVQHVSTQAISGVLYGAELTSEGVTDRYLTVLNPSLSSDLSELMQPGGGPNLAQVKFVPPSAESFTTIDVRDAGSLPERALKTMAPRFDLVGSLALKGLVMGLRQRMGVEGADSLDKSVGDEITLIKFGDDEPEAMLVAVRDHAAMTPYIDQYLSQKGASVSQERYNGIDLQVSSNTDGRAAAFIQNVLVLGTRSQIAAIINYQNGSAERGGTNFSTAVRQAPKTAAIISCKPDSEVTGRVMLAVSRVTRVTDGSPELLQKDSVRKALRSLPPSLSFTEFREGGVYTEARSAAGNFGLLVTSGGGE